ncbi:MAG TPA: UpxY family transcription antiterminator [Ignavibacteriaceae bacterium]|nr:UpxY family transcription antiterminator [Ignavibacteriaceae bacterium]
MGIINNEKKWYALHIKPRQEFKAEAGLISLGIENYLPTIVVYKQWSDRKKRVTEPLIKSYIFIKANEKERLATLELKQVIRCLFYAGRPAAIPEFEIINLKNFISDKYEYRVVNSIVKGSIVKINDGPLAGVTGVVIDEQDGKYFAVSVELLNRSVITHIKDPRILEIFKEQKPAEN